MGHKHWELAPEEDLDIKGQNLQMEISLSKAFGYRAKPYGSAITEKFTDT